MSVADLRYPIGKFDPATMATGADVQRGIDAIAAFPAQFRAAVAGLNDAQLDTPYAELNDIRDVPVETSLVLLEMMHQRWVSVLRGISEADFARGYVHPEHGRLVPLRESVGTYAWHGRHHMAHVTMLRERMGW